MDSGHRNRIIPILLAAITAVLVVAAGLWSPAAAAGADKPAQRQEVTCYDDAALPFCDEDDLHRLVEKAGSEPTTIRLGSHMYIEMTKTLVIPSGADIELKNFTTTNPKFPADSGLVRDNGSFTGSLIRVEKGAKLTLTQDESGLGDIIIDSRAYSQNVTGGSFAPTVLVEGEMVMNHGTIRGARKMNQSFEGAVTVRGADAKLAMNGGAITDNQRMDAPSRAQYGAANIALDKGADMAMNAGEVSKGRASTNHGAYGETGGIGVFNGATLTVNGGKITDNAGWAGNINVFSWLQQKPEGSTDDSRSHVEINGGEISAGRAGFGGGGVDVFANGDVTMNDGVIKDNRAPTAAASTPWTSTSRALRTPGRKFPATARGSDSLRGSGRRFRPADSP